MTNAVGIVANLAAGKDIRRLVSWASSSSDIDKRSAVARVAFGAMNAGADRLVVMPDRRHLVLSTLADLDLPIKVEELQFRLTGDARDSVRAAAAMKDESCGSLVVLGGDGTNRAVALGWSDAPVVPISSGTNNVFPRAVEATVAGAAAALVACGTIALDDVAKRAKVVHVEAEGLSDIALVDAALVDGQFVGSKALWEPDKLRAAFFARAEPAAVGLSAIGGAIRRCTADDEGGVLVRFGPGFSVRAPIVPGHYSDIAVADARAVGENEPIRFDGPGVLALDGEREHVLPAGESAVLQIRRDGPWLIDAERAVEEGARLGAFHDCDERGS